MHDNSTCGLWNIEMLIYAVRWMTRFSFSYTQTTPTFKMTFHATQWLHSLVDSSETTWTLPFLSFLIPLLVRWAVSLSPYSGDMDLFPLPFRHTNSTRSNRLQHTSNVWRLWSTASLDGGYTVSRLFSMVQIWSWLVGSWLSTFDGVSQLALWYYASILYLSWYSYHDLTIHSSGTMINPEWFALDASRGYESHESKFFMRTTVIVSEALIYTTALWYFCRMVYPTKKVNMIVSLGKITKWHDVFSIQCIYLSWCNLH